MRGGKSRRRMSKKETGLSFTQQYRIVEPLPEDASPILKSEWRRIRKMVERIRPSGSLFNNLGYVLLGISGSALVGAFTIPKTEGTSSVICWAIFGASLFAALLCMLFSHQQRGTLVSTKGDALNEMNNLENKYKGLKEQ